MFTFLPDSSIKICPKANKSFFLVSERPSLPTFTIEVCFKSMRAFLPGSQLQLFNLFLCTLLQTMLAEIRFQTYYQFFCSFYAFSCPRSLQKPACRPIGDFYCPLFKFQCQYSPSKSVFKFSGAHFFSLYAFPCPVFYRDLFLSPLELIPNLHLHFNDHILYRNLF